MLGQYNGPDSDDEDDDVSEEEMVTNKVRYIDADEDDSPHSQSSNELIANSSQIQEIIGFGSVNDTKDVENDTNDDEIYDADTDSESNANSQELNEKVCDDIPSKVALDLFKEKYFHFYGPFDDKEKQILSKYITLYKGLVFCL